jgi:hypothetical protein
MFSPGHCWAVILRTAIDVAFNFGLNYLVAQYGNGFTSLVALAMLRNGGDLRKSRDFLFCLREALNNAFVREYWDTLADKDTASLDGLLLFIKDKEMTDIMIKNLAHLTFVVLPALTLEKGMRNNDMVSFWGAVKKLLPLLVIRDNYKYVRVIFREIGIYQHQCPDEVREEYKLIWCFFCQGLDFILEEVNRRIKRNVIRGSFLEYVVASVMHDQQVDLTHAFLRALGLEPVGTTGEYIQAAEFFQDSVDRKRRLCQKQSERAILESMDGCVTGPKELMVGSDLPTMLESAERYTERYATDFVAYRNATKRNLDAEHTNQVKAVDHSKLPPPTNMTRGEQDKKRRISAFFDASFVTPDEDDSLYQEMVDDVSGLEVPSTGSYDDP